MVVEAKFGENEIRFFNGYGYQEDDPVIDKFNFFSKLREEIEKAKILEKMICIEMDANAKIGAPFIPGDTNSRSINGQLLKDIIDECDLIVVNATDKCEGVITRTRTTTDSQTNKERVENSVIDYFIVCKKMYDLISKMIIDEDRNHTLTKYATTTGNKKKIKSDHNPLILNLDIPWRPLQFKTQRTEIINFKNLEGQQKFYDLTSNSENLTNCFNSNKSFQTQSKEWLKMLNSFVHKSFPIIRIKDRPKDHKLTKLMDKKLDLNKRMIKEQNSVDKILINKEIEQVEEEIGSIVANNNKDIIKEDVNEIADAEGEFNAPKLWKLKKKLFPKGNQNLIAIKDTQGNLITSKKGILERNLQGYKERLLVKLQ